MERRFSQLRWKDRLRIEKMLKEGRKVQEIADALRVHNSTIYREIKRGAECTKVILMIWQNTKFSKRSVQNSKNTV